MAAINSWVIRDVPLATFVEPVTRKPFAYLSDVKTSDLTVSSDTVYAKGGSGNPNIIGFNSNKQAKFNISNAVFDNTAIALQTGNPIIKGAKAIQQREVLTVATNSATLTYTPVSTTGAIVGVFKRNPDGSHGAEITFTASTVATTQYTHSSSKTLGFFAGDFAAGEQVIVYYMTNTDALAQTIVVSTNKFPSAFGLVLDTVAKSPYDGKDYRVQFNIYLCKAEDNWTISMSADGDPSAHTMPIECLKQAGQTDYFTMTVFDGTTLT
ncbi:hypothetical protein BC351_10560 [Paenibacillus ferrarius]|uniref:Uncharacterized protein n=1 Tax=Paenibacillus ferrarius TaxID=1469647 RepID=A0A1V4H9H3_9BACL|nr:hypothetical protein [Paenibacillus ferrarius]OPH47622.1 hypothetical protein BC351_10560 [Paenibacillus ferrarius]